MAHPPASDSSTAVTERARARGAAILAPLDEEQRAAATAIDGPTLVLGGAGTGKSQVLAHQIAFACAAGRVPPRRLLVLVSSVEAGEVMAARAARLLGAPLHGAWIGTFREACSRILRSHAGAVGRKASFTILEEADARTLIRRVAVQLGVDEPPARLQEAIAAVKIRGVAPAGTVARVFPAYEQALAEANAFDTYDLLHHVRRLLADDEALRQKYRRRFEQVFVDDFQDTTGPERRLLQLLVGEEANVHLAADPDAAVRAVSAPEPESPLDAAELWPGGRVFELTRNYRSTKRIVHVASRLAAHNPGPHVPLEAVRRRGGRVISLTSANEQEEAALVVRWIHRMARRGEARPERVAVLVRQPVQLRPFEEALVREGIPYNVAGGPRFYERREIKDTLAYLRLCLPPGSPRALARIANAPRRGIGPASVRTLARLQKKHGVSLAEAAMRAASLPRVTAARAGALADLRRLLDDLEEAARNKTATELVDYVIERSGYGTLLTELSSAEEEMRREGIDELRGIARGFPGPAAEALPQLFQRLALVGGAPWITDGLGDEPTAEEEVAPPSRVDGVQLMTFADARGGETDVVFLVGLEEGVMPSRRALQAGEPAIRAERRLVYLGMSRARNRLILLSVLGRTLQGELRTGAPSRFLREAGKRVRWFRVGGARPAVMAPIAPAEGERPTLAAAHAGQRVTHPVYGAGVVTGSDGRFVTVRFEDAGEKRLALGLARLRPA